VKRKTLQGRAHKMLIIPSCVLAYDRLASLPAPSNDLVTLRGERQPYARISPV
jgi:hypothetical protein